MEKGGGGQDTYHPETEGNIILDEFVGAAEKKRHRKGEEFQED